MPVVYVFYSVFVLFVPQTSYRGSAPGCPPDPLPGLRPWTPLGTPDPLDLSSPCWFWPQIAPWIKEAKKHKLTSRRIKYATQDDVWRF